MSPEYYAAKLRSIIDEAANDGVAVYSSSDIIEELWCGWQNGDPKEDVFIADISL